MSFYLQSSKYIVTPIVFIISTIIHVKHLPTKAVYAIGESQEAIEITAEELIPKSIAYHDPLSNWQNLDAVFDFTTIMADESKRKRVVRINNKGGEFTFSSRHEEGLLEYVVKENVGVAKWNDSTSIPEDMSSKYSISNDRALLYRNYYTYLYGMPMKLTDPGAIIEPTVERVSFHGMTYDRIRVTYHPEVGTDTWYFYFNTESHALEAYQFYKDESKNDGEYILFEEMLLVDNIKIPRIRHWYYNTNEEFLATDILESDLTSL